MTPLFAASQNNHDEIVTLLLNASALVDLARNVSSLCVYQTLVIINDKWAYSGTSKEIHTDQ